MQPLPPLTRRQRQILDFFQEYTSIHGISPTLEEVAKHFGVNKVTIFGHVSELERKGILARAARGVSRGLQVVAAPPPRSPTSIPVLGRIAAGTPIQALESEPAGAEGGGAEAGEMLAWEDLLPRGRDVFALRVQGQSMVEDGIHDGDFVIVERRSNARDGEVVVAVLPDEEATLKRMYREPGGFRLEPANATMEPIHTPEIEVRGVVIGVVRRF